MEELVCFFFAYMHYLESENPHEQNKRSYYPKKIHIDDSFMFSIVCLKQVCKSVTKKVVGV